LEIKLIANDNCTAQPDTAQMLVSILPTLKLETRFQDTFCFAETYYSVAEAKGGTGDYSFIWLDSFANPIAYTDSLKLTHFQKEFYGNMKYSVILGDACTSVG